MNFEELPPLHQLSTSELQDLIDDLELDMTLEELVAAARLLSQVDDVDQFRDSLDALESLRKAA